MPVSALELTLESGQVVVTVAPLVLGLRQFQQGLLNPWPALVPGLEAVAVAAVVEAAGEELFFCDVFLSPLQYRELHRLL